MKGNRPLDDVRVLDMSTLMTGPLCGQILADYGADVIKLERPEGDAMRHAGPMRHAQMGPMYMHANRNKRSVCIDAKKPGAIATILKIAATCDVFLTNIRPAAMRRLGLAPEQLRQVRPDLIYVSIVGFGQGGPYAKKPVVDDVTQSASGMADMVRRYSGEPRYVPSVMADRVTGLSAAHAVIAALYQRTRTGRGQDIEVPMFETLAAFVMGDHLGGLSFDPPAGPTGYNRLITPHRRPFRTSDGYIGTSVYTNRQWKAFLGAIGQGDLYDSDPRFHDAAVRAGCYDEVYGMLGGIFAGNTTAYWLGVLEGCDIPCSPVRSVDELIHDPHLQAVGFFEEFDHPHEGRMRTMNVTSKWSDADMSIRRHAPKLGEQTREILAECGYVAEEIERLLAQKVALEG